MLKGMKLHELKRRMDEAEADAVKPRGPAAASPAGGKVPAWLPLLRELCIIVESQQRGH